MSATTEPAPVAAAPAPPRRARLALRPRVRRALLCVHIIAGVGLLGDVAAVLAVNVRAATTGDAELAAASYELLAMFTLLFGIPLSLASLGTGILLGLSSAWGVVRYGWVSTKLALLIGVILVGSFVLGPGTDAMRSGEGGAEARLIAGSAYDVLALTLATGLSVFKPRRRRVADALAAGRVRSSSATSARSAARAGFSPGRRGGCRPPARGCARARR